ncbi:hypothetical protein SELMODRAFT_154794 [Selaginella moellendorffii]|uniref:Eukaryotic translation initiation factor 3 subunit K n=1 Tax=Selaginella moellendorffii TaxID=88036 RepID=D8SEY1_SELML|nr:eukaryotic translation initiation factor 3 subunit K [Selaginella moellendorffii]XP_002982949.1 eukaryotic translation initiation factor 3 subunit K [Selaginella moellendorffii]EFJ16194.1 hypothetical protein SELMODRAFT_155471 [Selaginella moellendorffii]EFJ17062.1 hypothetical protein SELMODRAFT_154794 [Selaginella moellendorffii]|eukprot:XP_002981969.1 eukaryotic translation initiation factor 3 subunit K [Selaginella moellendorffii]
MVSEWEREQEQPQLTMEQLVALNPYNPDILPDLEAYVQEQVATETYSFDSNLCLLRLYQFEPRNLNVNIVTKILVKALMAMPAPDFGLCMCLVPERLHMLHPFFTLATLSHYLETARFREFWDEAARNRDILEVIPGFESAIQSYGVHVLSLTYQKVPRAVLAEALNLEGLSLDKYLEFHAANSGWKLHKGHGGSQVVTLPSNEYNDPSQRKNAGDNISLDVVSKLFPVLA